MNDFKFLIFVGPSGSGKTTVASKLKSLGAVEAISTTTRSPRPGEIDGVHYHFVSQTTFSDLVIADAFVEYATYGDKSYGLTTVDLYDAVEASPIRVAVCVMEIIGFIAARKRFPDMVRGIFVDCDRETAERRLRSRGDLTDALLQQRLSLYDAEYENRSMFTDDTSGHLHVFNNHSDGISDIETLLKEWSNE